MALKKNQPALRVGFPGHSSFGISDDEMDAYRVYNVNNPVTDLLGVKSVGTTAVTGTSGTAAVVITSKYPDYPRNVAFVYSGTGGGMSGTLTLNGKDQFGSLITEAIGIGTADNGGTTSGTKVFGQFISGTVVVGTAVGNGTTNIRFVAGTDCLFGLPCKIGATTDVVHYGHTTGTGMVNIGGGTAIGSLVNVRMHAFRPFVAFIGTSTLNVWVKSTYTGDSEGEITRQAQAA
jgi:hypothetical protein